MLGIVPCYIKDIFCTFVTDNPKSMLVYLELISSVFSCTYYQINVDENAPDGPTSQGLGEQCKKWGGGCFAAGEVSSLWSGCVLNIRTTKKKKGGSFCVN